MRKPTENEINLICFLIKQSTIELKDEYLSNLLVTELNDGKMGGLLLYPNGIINKNRIFGKRIAEYQFKDIDGVDVIVSLNVDSNGLLFELDIWKTNFEELIQLPISLK